MPRVFAPAPFRWTDGIDYPYGYFDMPDDTKARAMKLANKVGDDPGSSAAASLGTGIVRILAMSAVPIVHTGTTSATVLVDIPIPAPLMGINSALRITPYWSMTNNANSKNLVVLWGNANVQIWSAGLSSVAAASCQIMVSNRGSTGSQVFTSTGTGVSYGTLPGFGTASEDTTIAQRIRFTGNLANAADTLTLERYVVELLS